MQNNPISGIGYFFQGFALIFKPGIRLWVLIPLLLNIFLLSGMIYSAWLYFPGAFESIVTHLETGLPDWRWIITLMRWIMLPLFIVLVLIGVFFTFTFFANIISEPFNGLLAAAVERHLTGKPVKSPQESWFKIIIRFIAEKIGKLFYYLKWAIILLILSIIPIINIISPILWFLFAAWIACLEYADAPLGNHGYKPSAQRKRLAEKRMLSLGFGSAVVVAMLIPIINFLVMPVAVAGATCMWVYEFAPEH